jgi:hypothetical protein
MIWKQIISYITQRAMAQIVDGEDAGQGPASRYWQRYVSAYHYSDPVDYTDTDECIYLGII